MLTRLMFWEVSSWQAFIWCSALGILLFLVILLGMWWAKRQVPYHVNSYKRKCKFCNVEDAVSGFVSCQKCQDSVKSTS